MARSVALATSEATTGYVVLMFRGTPRAARERSIGREAPSMSDKWRGPERHPQLTGSAARGPLPATSLLRVLSAPTSSPPAHSPGAALQDPRASAASPIRSPTDPTYSGS